MTTVGLADEAGVPTVGGGVENHSAGGTSAQDIGDPSAVTTIDGAARSVASGASGSGTSAMVMTACCRAGIGTTVTAPTTNEVIRNHPV